MWCMNLERLLLAMKQKMNLVVLKLVEKEMKVFKDVISQNFNDLVLFSLTSSMLTRSFLENLRLHLQTQWKN